MERQRSSNLFCFWISVTLAGACPKSISLYNLSTVAFDDICLSPCVMFEKLRSTERTPRRALMGFSKASSCWCHPFNTVLYGSTEIYRESLVRSQVKIMQNEKSDTFESLSFCFTDRNFSKYIELSGLQSFRPRASSSTPFWMVCFCERKPDWNSKALNASFCKILTCERRPFGSCEFSCQNFVFASLLFHNTSASKLLRAVVKHA